MLRSPCLREQLLSYRRQASVERFLDLDRKFCWLSPPLYTDTLAAQTDFAVGVSSPRPQARSRSWWDGAQNNSLFLDADGQ